MASVTSSISSCSLFTPHNPKISAMSKDFHFNKKLQTMDGIAGKNNILSDMAKMKLERRERATMSIDVPITSSSVLSSSMKTHKNGGRLSTPRAGRELAMSIIYASCLEGSSDPLALFHSRVNQPQISISSSSDTFLSEYDLTSFGGPPLTVHSVEEEEDLKREEREQSIIEEAVLGGSLKTLYTKHILEFTRSLLMAVTHRWDTNVVTINKLVPPSWNNEAAGARILELCILHLAMSEIVVLKTRHQIVINEAVDLSKRFCDGAAPRVINGCLRSFVTLLEEQQQIQASIV